ncbi:sensor histidine kinase [Glycomyces algeriensis]|uniref:histidine kinase n=1 Tax=Glycomyces algeriensis TaxID=256037 RepID=A0A9W6LIS7_9ACTN|nr:histidine kinase [Glycomyces algeriensis]MDA1367836.1 histidine kinase [Glycomyces algeriensis]MDR7351982.1 signal transduction histidine kinase [Glycomyces algeriensis]GLI44715.1 two-component sensor histidine kinase [Glycomyces algeriensis]
MNRLRRWWRPWMTDMALVVVSALDVWVVFWWGEPTWDMWLIGAGVLALLLRRRRPMAVFLVTLPTALFMGQAAAPLIALFTLASRTHRRRLLAVATLVLATCMVWPVGVQLSEYPLDSWILADAAYALAPAAAAAFLGQLVQVRRELSARLVEITEAREHEQLMATQKVLSEERAQLAREMHDVVSHQVSLIAVRAGALQVSTADAEAKEAAGTIRTLSVRTLDELRHMVNVLRAGGSGPTDLAPQPTLAQLADLVAGSGIEATLRIGPHPELGPPAERAIYRTVQESLTNVRKHAPGASAKVVLAHEGGGVTVTVHSTAPTRPAVPLPSSRHGLLGLHQRAALLGGTLTWAATPDGGWRNTLTLPV